MKIKTQDLTGPAIDWAVAKAEGYTNLRFHQEPPLAGAWIMDPPRKAYGPVLLSDCAFSTDWAQGGPLIEREGIALHGNPAWCAQYSVAVRAHHGGYRGYFRHVGPTPLIAAMRCYVASKLGDTIDIPEELA